MISQKLKFGLILSVIACLPLVAYSAQWESHWMSQEPLNGYITDVCLLDKVTTLSTIECATECLARLECFFTKSSECQLHSTLFNAATNTTLLTYQPGALYFFEKDRRRMNESLSGDEMCLPSKCIGCYPIPYTGRYWKILTTHSGSCDAASDQCQQYGGRLAAPKDLATIGEIQVLIHASLDGNEVLKGLWVNAKYNSTLNDFVWQDDHSVVDKNLWHPGQPEKIQNVTSGADRNCVVLVPLYKYKLNDYRCDITRADILPLCECH